MKRLVMLLSLILMQAACAPSTVSPVSLSAAETLPGATTAPSLPSPTAGTPYIMPTPPPTAQPVCAGAPPPRLILHERGRVLPDDPRPINMRRAAGVENIVVTQIPIRGLFLVLEGPVCGGDYVWWRVRYNGLDGWVAEGDGNGYYIEPYLTG